MKTSHEFADDMLDAAPDFSTFCELVSARDAEHEAALAKSRAECELLKAQLGRAVGLLTDVFRGNADYRYKDIGAFLAAPSQPEPAKEGA